MRLLCFAGDMPAGGTTDLDAALRHYALAARRAGLLLLITDFFSPAGYRAGLGQLQGRGYELAVLHVLAPDELEPPLAGDLRLVDMETGAAQDVTLDGSLRDLYRRRVEAWRSEIETYCAARGIHYVGVSTATPWDELVLYQLRRRHLVK
jgi:uncharacterized protein (DUF58 family)